MQGKSRHKVIEKLFNKKNFDRPLNPEQVQIRNSSKKRHILLKPELDTGLTTEVMEKLKSQKMKKQRKSSALKKENIVSRNENYQLMNLNAP